MTTITGSPVSSNLYGSVAGLKTRLSITDTTDDTVLTSILTAVCRAIENYTGRRFWRDSTASTRYYSPRWCDVLYIDDLVSITTLKSDEDDDRDFDYTWTETDYDLYPLNASADGWPYTRIQVTPEGDYSFPVGPKTVQIVGVFGWPTVPYAVIEAAYLWSERVYKRKDAPFGIASTIEAGEMRLLKEMDVDVQTLLNPYRVLAEYF